MRKGIKPGWLPILTATSVVVCTIAAYMFLPGNLTYMKRAKGHHLSNDVKEWEMLSRPQNYGHTNLTHEDYLWRTNLVVGSNVITTVMRLDSSLFSNRGYLVADSNRVVFWVRRDGRAEALWRK